MKISNFNYQEFYVPTYKKHQPTYDLNTVLGDGGAGDNIARMPVIKWMLDQHPHLNIKLVVHNFMVEIVNNYFPNEPRLEILTFDKPENYNKDNIARATHIHVYTNLSSHMTTQGFAVLGNCDVPDHLKNYLQLNLDAVDITRYNLPKDYVVVTTDFTSATREMHPLVINELCAYITNKGYMPVFLGKSNVDTGIKFAIKGNFNPHIDFTKGLDLREQTTLLESAKVIAGAKTIVGLDNGLIHLAATANKELPIVCGFTTVQPRHRAPYRNNILGYKFYPVIPDAQSCRFCQSNYNFTHNFDFKYCYNTAKFPENEEWGLQCVRNLTADKYIKELDKIL